jgi:hypothetical protein
MNAPPTRQRPAGTGRDVAQQIELARQLYGTSETAARAGYCGITPPAAPPPQRDPALIARDLRSAAECLGNLADSFERGHVNEASLAGADRLLIGASRLIVELRQRGQR